MSRDKKKAAEFETIDYQPQDSQQYRRWLQTQPMNQQWDRWTMMFLVGVVVGVVAFLLHTFFSTLAKWKVQPAAELLALLTPAPPQTNTLRAIIANSVGLGWLFNVSYSLALVAVSAGSVLWLSPAAAGSGVPEVMAYLNGCHLPKARAGCTAQPGSATHLHCRCLSGRRQLLSFFPAPAVWARACLWGRKGP